MKKKILVVDDNPNIVEAIMLILHTQNYTVKSLLRGNTVQTVCARYRPDVLILDLLLSGKNGAGIAKQMKLNKKTKHIPIIIISAHPSAKQAALDSGANAFLEKPFDADKLLALVGQLSS